MSEERFARLETQVSEIARALVEMEKAMAIDEVTGNALSTRLDKIEGTLTWLVRLIIGAIVLGLIPLAFAGAMPGVGG